MVYSWLKGFVIIKKEKIVDLCDFDDPKTLSKLILYLTCAWSDFRVELILKACTYWSVLQRIVLHVFIKSKCQPAHMYDKWYKHSRRINSACRPAKNSSWLAYNWKMNNKSINRLTTVFSLLTSEILENKFFLIDQSEASVD